MKNLPDAPELVDGIFPSTGTYIQCSIPYEWLTEEAFDGEGDIENLIPKLDLVELIEGRLAEGICEFSVPTRKNAERTIAALRTYAEYLEREFIDGPRACNEEDAT